MLILAAVGIAALASFVILSLFAPGLRYKVMRAPALPLDSGSFCRTVESLCHSRIHRNCCIEVLTNGEVFYPAELEAIRRAERTVNLEAYIFQRGEVGERFVEALAERARAGVRVNVVLDAIGALMTPKSYFEAMTAAGGKVAFYHPLRWYTWPRMNNRTHRELLIVDGRIGFIGGAGWADHWLKPPEGRRWRDSMFRVEGEAVASLQAAFSENWLEASSEVLAGDDYFPELAACGSVPGMVVASSPTAGGSTRARMLFQMLLSSARNSVCLTTPYFLPDDSARDEMIKAIRERGVEIRVVTPGKHSDHLLTRRSSRRLYGPLLRAGARIFEYRPSMIHAKVLIADDLWCVVGSTNFDHRSFGLNDEVNMAMYDGGVAARLRKDFERDVAESNEITYDQWRRRSIIEKVQEPIGWLLERQQ